MGVAELDEQSFDDVYGPWAGHGPSEVAELFRDYPGTWWVAGGWALEAFTGVPRPHHDVDPSVLRAQVPLLRRHLAGRQHLWMANSGALCPLLPLDRPDASADEVLEPGCGQFWTRRDARHPWEFDILLAHGTPEQWVYKRDERIRRPMAEALWQRDGIRWLRPELQLLHKARRVRPKDQWDFEVTVPLLDADARRWLRDALRLTEPGHPWITTLD